MMIEPNHSKNQYPHTVAVVSGKGGVGKTNIAVNLAVLLASFGKRVLLFDADMGLSSVDVMLNLAPQYTLQDVLSGRCDICDTLVDGPGGVKVLPAASGVCEMAELKHAQMDWLQAQVTRAGRGFDFIIIDAPPGIGINMQRVTELADEALIVTTPEPTAVIDAYAVAKVFSSRQPDLPLSLVVNMISAQDTGERISTGFHQVVSRFLDRKIETIARMPYDNQVPLAVRRQQAFTLCYPDCPAARTLRMMALALLGGSFKPAVQSPALYPDTAYGSGQQTAVAVNRVSPWLDPTRGAAN